MRHTNKEEEGSKGIIWEAWGALWSVCFGSLPSFDSHSVSRSTSTEVTHGGAGANSRPRNALRSLEMLFQRGLMLPVGMEQLVGRYAVPRRDFDTLVGCMVVLVAILNNVVNMVLENQLNTFKQG